MRMAKLMGMMMGVDEDGKVNGDGDGDGSW